jgi:V8-like Glu-specific endopeptidase
MISNESAIFDRIGITPRLPNDSTTGQDAAVAHAYSTAGQNDYLAAIGSKGSSLPDGFPSADQLHNDLALHIGTPAALRPLPTAAPESIAAPATVAAAPESIAAPAAAPESIAAPETVAAAPESITAPAAAPESIAAPATAATAPESITAPAATDATSAPAAAALTPEQAAIAQATVQLQTPEFSVGPNGELSEVRAFGTGFIVNGTDANGNPTGQQFIVTAGHVPAATGQDGISGENGQISYASDPTTVTFADGTQTTATVVANNTELPPNNYVQLSSSPDIAVLSIPYSGVLAPYPALNLNPNAQLTKGDTLTSVGYPAGGLTGTDSTYLGTQPLSQGSLNSNNPTPVLETTGAARPGMSGSPVVDSNGDVVGVLTSGTGTTTDSTPISNATNLINGLTPFGPNDLSYLLNGSPQPMASMYDMGNGSDQSLTGINISLGGTTTSLDNPKTAAPASSTPDVAPPTAPTPDAPPVAAPPATDAPPAVTPPVTDAPPVATPPLTYTPPAYDTPAPGDDFSGGDFSGGDFYAGGGGGNRMSMDVDS